MSLRAEGFCFVRRDKIFQWVHPTSLRETDEDCTDMTDDEFTEFFDVCQNQDDHQPRPAQSL